MDNEKLRILQVITNLGTGGAEKLLVDSMPIYKDRGIGIDLLLLDGTPYPFNKLLQERGINIISLGQGSVYNPLHVFRIIPYLKKYDIIHVHLFPTLYWVAIAKMLSFSSVKLVFTEHSTNNKRFSMKIGAFFDKLIYRAYSSIVSITPEVESILKTHLLINDDDVHFSIIQNGINLTNFNQEKYLDLLDKEVIRLIQVSSFNKAKDQETLIRALSILPGNVSLLLVGEGENRVACESLVKDLQMVDRVHFLGVRTDIPELFKISSIAVLSSHFEGFGLSAVEAMASKTPLIASDVPGLSGVVAGAGVLFPVGDEKALAKEIQKLLSDKDYYNEVAVACQERAKTYDINIMVDQYIELYKSLV